MSDSLYIDNYAERKKRAGRCVRSGCYSPPSEGHVTCAPCRAKIQASRVRLRALRAAQQKRQAAVLVKALSEHTTRTVRDGRNEFDSLWDGRESLYALVEKWHAARTHSV